MVAGEYIERDDLKQPASLGRIKPTVYVPTKEMNMTGRTDGRTTTEP